MKKSILTILTFVLVIANLVLTINLTLNVIPQAKSANELITKVCEAIELDIASSDADESSVPLDQIETYDLITEDSTITVNLAKGSDGQAHYAVLAVTLSLNTASSAYETYGANMDAYASKMKSIVTSTVSSFTIDEMQGDQLKVQTAIKDKLNAMFGASNYIVAVDFPKATYQ